MDQASNQEDSFVTVPYIQGLSEESRRIFKDTKVQIIFKGCNTQNCVNASQRQNCNLVVPRYGLSVDLS